MVLLHIMDKIIDYLTNNPKDFANIFFWLFTSLLAFFTYINAKKTLFNPIRSEMVKYQMKTLTEFIDNHTAKGFTFDNAIDYSNLLKLNYETDYLFDLLTNEANFADHQFDELDQTRIAFCKENLGGLFEVSEKNKVLYLDPVYADFEIAKQYIQTRYIKDKEKDNEGLVLQRFYLTNKFYSFFADLQNLQTNPFVPDTIKKCVALIIANIYKNIQILYEILSTHISAQTQSRYQNIYSEFNKSRIDHQKDLEDLRKRISIYFKVNRI